MIFSCLRPSAGPGEFRLGQVDDTHFSISHSGGQTIMIFRSDGTLHGGPRTRNITTKMSRYDGQILRIVLSRISFSTLVLLLFHSGFISDVPHLSMVFLVNSEGLTTTCGGKP